MEDRFLWTRRFLGKDDEGELKRMTEGTGAGGRHKEWKKTNFEENFLSTNLTTDIL